MRGLRLRMGAPGRHAVRPVWFGIDASRPSVDGLCTFRLSADPGARPRTEERPMAARLRRIATSVPDPDKAADFFEQAFGMKRVGKAGIGCYVSDGTINVALLKYEGEVPGFAPGFHGLIHFGMWVDNLEEAV